jgi:uncharacterized protein (DUF433 family)
VSTDTSTEELIARWIQENPNKPGIANAGILGSRLGVWVLIEQLQLDDWNLADVAESYELPTEAVEAAVAYYERHQAEIDARIVRNRAFFATL